MRAPALLILAAWLLAATLVTGCRSRAAGPELLSVVEITPHEVDVGDRLEIVGSGFPDGKPATITLRGQLDQPGRSPRGNVEIVARGASRSPHRVTFKLDEALRVEFCGRAVRAAHTTFHGQVMVAFAPRDPAAPPITGTLHDVTLDVDAPPAPRSVQSERRAEGERALRFLGLTVHPDATASSLTVTAVRARGPAAQVGIARGDVLLAFDGVRVHSPSDVIPRGGSHWASLVVRRGMLSEPIVRRVDVLGFKRQAPAVLAPGAVLIGLFAAILFVFMGPSATLLTWLERRMAHRLSKRGRRDQRRGFWVWLLAGLGDLLADDAASGGERIVSRLVPCLLFLAASAAFTLLAFGRRLVGVDLDLGILLLSGTTAVSAIGLIMGGWRGGRRWSLLSGLRGAFAVLSAQLPAVAAIACVVLSTGSLRFEDIVLDQGGLPWRWHAFQSPMLLLSFAVFIAALLPVWSRSPHELPELETGAPSVASNRPRARGLMFLAEWGNLFVLSGIGCMLFLGGYRLPLVSASAVRANLGYQALGAVLLELKCWFFVLFVLWLRWLLPRFVAENVVSVCWRRLVPLSVLALVATTGWLAGLNNPFFRSVEQLVSYVLFGLVVFVVGYFAHRVVANLRGNSAAIQLNVNPWL